MGHIHNILVPVDGSPASIEALARAVDLAEDVDGTVSVLHVIASEMAAEGVGAQDDRLLEDAITAAKGRLGGRLSRRSVSGEPLRKILETAAEDMSDLIVIGTHGRLGRLHALVGSVTEGVVRNAPCPVMTVRHPDGEEESFSERIHGREALGEQARLPR